MTVQFGAQLVQCQSCGWKGNTDDLDETKGRCPKCDGEIEIIWEDE